jgi:hypothetical protein
MRQKLTWRMEAALAFTHQVFRCVFQSLALGSAMDSSSRPSLGKRRHAAGDLTRVAASALSANSSIGLFLPRNRIGPRARAETPAGIAS